MSHVVVDTDMGVVDPLDYQWAGLLGSKLAAKYPFVSWQVDVNGRAGVATVEIPELHMLKNKHYGVVIDMTKIGSASEFEKKAIMAAGELLERAFMSRETGERSAEGVDRS